MDSKTETVTILDFKACPHCGSHFAYYIKMYASGWIRDRRMFEDREPYNPEMYDSLSYSRESKYYFCDACDKPICKVTPPIPRNN